MESVKEKGQELRERKQVEHQLLAPVIHGQYRGSL
jgi:hypothetical protein